MRAKRAINLLASQYWALEPDKLEAVAELVENLMLGRKPTNDPLASVAGEEGTLRPYRIENRVAIIPVDGVIAYRLNLFQSISGGSSTEIIGKQVSMAADDTEIEAILLDISSPGGAVHGLADLAATIRAANKTKPIIAWTGENMCSAAYWIGSAANEVICSSTACVGSIGVYYIHVETSDKDAKDGITRTVFRAGRYKAAGNDAEPLSDDGREVIQANVDDYHSLFINTVASNLGMSVDDVLSKLADGRTHIGEKALTQGLVHSIGDQAFAISRALELACTSNQEAKNMPAGTANNGGNGTQANSGSGAVDISALTAEQLAAENPKLAAALIDKGAEAERERATAIIEANASAKLTLAAVKDGTSPESFYKSALDAERGEKKKALDDFEASLNDSAGQSGKETADTSGQDFMALVDEHVKANEGCTKTAAILAVGRKHPEVHQAYLNQARR